MLKTHKYRLYPNKTQEAELMKWMRVMCDVYCNLVDYKARLWESSIVRKEGQDDYKAIIWGEKGRHAGEKDLREMFYKIRDIDPSIADLPQALFNVMIRFRIIPAYRSFFALIKKYKDDKGSLSGRPSTIDIKSHNNWAIIKRNRHESGDNTYAKDLPKRKFDSIQFGADPNNKHAWIDKGRLYTSLPRGAAQDHPFRKGIKARIHRPIDGDLRFIIVKREYNKWYACCSIECDPPVIEVPKHKREVGIDLGIKSIITTSDGKHYSQIEAYSRFAKKLNDLNAIRSRKEFGSKSHWKIRREIARTWEHIVNMRKTITDQVIHDLIENYDVIYHEDINVSDLLSRKDEKGRRKNINKWLSDQIWGAVLKKLGEKTKAIEGKELIAVPAHYTSQLCSNCYYIQKMPLGNRLYRCPRCGSVLDRDVNAAKNILNFGRQELCLFIAQERWRERHKMAAD